MYGGAAWVELCLDFVVSTRVQLCAPGHTVPGSLSRQAELFASVATRVAQLCGERQASPAAPLNGRPVPRNPGGARCSSLVPLRMPRLVGWSGRAALLRPEAVQLLLARRQAAHPDPATAAGGLTWTPVWRDLPPPLWGPDSFNNGAGMTRILTAARFIKARMPFGQPDLTDDEAYDVAAYVNSNPRPIKSNLISSYAGKDR